MSHENLEHHDTRVLVEVNCKAWEMVNFDVRQLCSSAVLATLNEVEMAKLPCEVSIVLADDNFVQNLNKIWQYSILHLETKVSNIFFINLPKKRKKTYETLKNRIIDQNLLQKMKNYSCSVW